MVKRTFGCARAKRTVRSAPPRSARSGSPPAAGRPTARAAPPASRPAACGVSADDPPRPVQHPLPLGRQPAVARARARPAGRPSCPSSCLIPADSVGWVMPRLSAARPKCCSLRERDEHLELVDHRLLPPGEIPDISLTFRRYAARRHAPFALAARRPARYWPAMDQPQPLKAAAWMMGAVVSFAAMAVAGRELQAEMNTFELMLYRSAIGFAHRARRRSPAAARGFPQVRSRASRPARQAQPLPLHRPEPLVLRGRAHPAQPARGARVHQPDLGGAARALPAGRAADPRPRARRAGSAFSACSSSPSPASRRSSPATSPRSPPPSASRSTPSTPARSWRFDSVLCVLFWMTLLPGPDEPRAGAARRHPGPVRRHRCPGCWWSA